MRLPLFLTATLLSALLLAAPSHIFAQDDDSSADKSDAKSSDKSGDKKPAEKALPADSTTQGSVVVGGQTIAYTAIAGTITVGSTDVQDAQLGMDGKPQAGSELSISAPKDPKDITPTARIFYVAYFKGAPATGLRRWGRRKTPRQKTAPSPFSITVARAVPPSGCTWARSAPST
jgi:hypothetical protein